ncbi:hypothetical protein [Vermiculatibacterium agrestimuris]|uniref:hypothetical protein n=1 Tax=Vermiculatibacterium agrestimuris TaxID=2941519 RepID=UPI00204052F5|nr:hypothetical protein [Vermiculatibacterium agrestimuris]
MKKRLVSILLTVAMCMGLAVPAVAVEIRPEAQKENVTITECDILGKTAVMEQHIVDREIDYVKITCGTEIAERIGNEIFLNGEKVATIVELEERNIDAQNIEPRTGWLDVENCPYGTKSEYNKLYSSQYRNLALEKKISELTVEGLSYILMTYCGVAGVCLRIAQEIISVAVDSKYEEYKTLYLYERIYSHKTLGQFYRMVDLDYYFDKNYTEFACNDYFYRVWA